MKNIGLCSAFVLAAVSAGLSSQAKADVWWSLKDVTFDDGGAILNGSFAVNVYGYITHDSVSVTTSAGTMTTATGGPLPGDTYNGDLVAPGINNPTDNTVTFFSGTHGYEGVLTLQFQDALTTAVGYNPIVGGIGGPSWECEVGFGCPPYSGTPIRYVTGGYASAPEAPTWAMMLLGFAGLGYAAFRTRRPVVATA